MKDLTILDGGMGHELAKRGAGDRDGLWSARALLEHPELVAEVHNEYIDAGARVIITNSYSTIPSYLEKGGMADRYLELTELAALIARRVADASPHPVKVAGSLPPLDVSYRPDMVPSDAASAPVYEALTDVLLPHVDLFLCETMTSAREAANAARAARKVAADAKPLWVSWSLDEAAGNGLRSGETVPAAYAAVAQFAPDTFLFNCTDPNAISAGLTELRDLTDKPIGAYPNRFHVPTGWTLDNDISTEPRDMTEIEFLDFARHWQSLGASIVGGCCGVGPDFINGLQALETVALDV